VKIRDEQMTAFSDAGVEPVSSCHEAEKKPTRGSKTKDNEITIEFDPAASKKVTSCKRIVMVQSVQKFVDGKPIMPGDYYSPWKYKDGDALTSGGNKGLRVDYLKGEKTPYYNDPQGTGSSAYGLVGKKNGGTSKSTMGDAPDTGGGDKGFYNKATNPTGHKKVETRFETFAYCAEGPDCGKWYEGLTWVHTKKHSDAGINSGVSKIKSHRSTPSKGFKAAFDKWNRKYGFTPCP
jgi:hypothetical protein